MIEIRDGYENMDFEKVTAMLTAFLLVRRGSGGRGHKGGANSALVVGAFLDNKRSVYARVISDKTRFAYVSDVIIDEPYRNQGIGVRLMEYLLNHRA
jgi:ribosomal protein S18 acetylase RimI-like enzyme